MGRFAARRTCETQGLSMSTKAMRILLIGQEPSDGRSVCEALVNVQDDVFIVECAPRLVAGLERLRANGIAAVLVDLRLPDSQGIAPFEQVCRAASHVPILIIGSPDDQDVARQAVKVRAGRCPTRPPRQLHVAACPQADHRAKSGGRDVVLRTAARGSHTSTQSATPCSAPMSRVSSGPAVCRGTGLLLQPATGGRAVRPAAGHRLSDLLLQ